MHHCICDQAEDNSFKQLSEIKQEGLNELTQSTKRQKNRIEAEKLSIGGSVFSLLRHRVLNTELRATDCSHLKKIGDEMSMQFSVNI